MGKFTSFITVFAICFALFNTEVHAASAEPGKVYLSSEQVVVNEDGIFIFESDAVFEIFSLHTDDCGLYIIPEESDLEIGADGKLFPRRCPNNHSFVCTICPGCNGHGCRFQCSHTK